MSEQSLGDISHNRIHQMLEALQAGGFSVDLFHRLRLDEEYRKVFVEQAQSLDKRMIGDLLLINSDPDFCHPVTLIKALKERSPYSGKQAYLLKDEILLTLTLYKTDYAHAFKNPPQYPLELYAMPLYKRMSRAEIREELRRRDLVSVGNVEALCLATCFCIGRNDSEIRVMNANVDNPLFDRENLCFGRNALGDPMLHLSGFSLQAGDYVDQGVRLLVKRKPA